MGKVKEKQMLIDAVIEDLKKGFALGDYTVLDELLMYVPTENLIKALPEEDWQKYSDVQKDYFQIVHTGFCEASQREEIQIHAGENANVFLFQDEDKLGFIVDVYGQNDLLESLTVWEDDLNPEDEIEKDDNGNCVYCGQKCWENGGQMCDEQQAGGFNNDKPLIIHPTAEEIKQFKNDWGQSHGEITSELGFPRNHSESDELILDTDNYFWIEKDKKWYNTHASLFTPREQLIADYLRYKK